MKKILAALTLLAAGGTLFAGYLSYGQVFTGRCLLGQTCPFMWGYPACVYGFGMFVLMLVITLLALGGISTRTMLRLNALIATLGIAFSGWLVVGEIVNGTLIGGSLGGSSCLWGRAMYIAILYFSRRGVRTLGV